MNFVGGKSANRTTNTFSRSRWFSGARLLYTNDAALIGDFKNREIVPRPGGKVYTTARNNRVTVAHRRLLSDRTLCRRP